MTVPETRRPSAGIAILVWMGIALALYGIAAVVGLGGLEEALEPVPGHGFIGGFFVGLALFAIPSVAGWALGRPLALNLAYPRASRALVWVGIVGMAMIGLLAALIDMGFLDLVIVDRP